MFVCDYGLELARRRKVVEVDWKTHANHECVQIKLIYAFIAKADSDSLIPNVFFDCLFHASSPSTL
jgi:hypothetical protein